MRMLPSEAEETDVEVTWEDQKSINTFSKLNVRLDDFQSKISAKKEEKEYLDDLTMELELADEDEPVRYKIDLSFILVSPARALEMVTASIERLDKEIEELDKEVDSCDEQMKDLKAKLYAKFGKAINLEKGDD